MSNDYTQTLPPVPDLRQVPHGQLAACVVTYGHACAEAARAHLAEENARLQARLRSMCQMLVEAVGADGPCDAEDASARAVARIAELEATLAGKEAAWEILDRSIGRLRAEVEALREDSVIEWEPGRSYTATELLRRVISNTTARKREMLWPAVMKLCGVGSTVAHYLCRWAGRDPDTGEEIAAIATQPSIPWVNPLAAEVEKLRAALVRARRGLAWASQQRPELIEDYEAVDTAIAARKGEGSEG